VNIEERTTMLEAARIYRALRAELELDHRRVAARIVSTTLPQGSFNRTRTWALRALGIQIAPSTHLAGTLRITGAGSIRELLSIGPGTYISGPLHIDLTAPVHIGARVRIGYDVEILTTDHEMGDALQRGGPRVFRGISIGDGVWLCSRTVILPGVNVGAGSVVAAGAVVTQDVPENILVGGVPARPIRHLEVASTMGEQVWTKMRADGARRAPS
jgi:maltose O-acetyltransferase